MSKKHFSWLAGLTVLAAVIAFLVPSQTAKDNGFEAAQLLPAQCPCERRAPLQLDEEELELRCTQRQCMPRDVAAMEFSAKALGVVGMGQSVCRDLLRAGLAPHGIWSVLQGGLDEERVERFELVE